LIPMSELIEGPVYRRFLQTPPKLPPISRDPDRMASPPWVVFVQREPEGPWGKKEFWKYKDAFKFLRKALKLKVHDATIHCKRVGFEPPHSFARVRGKYVVDSKGVKRQATKLVYWKPSSALLAEQPEHHWCMYCRRPVTLNYYRRHKAREGFLDSTVPRCDICGGSVRIIIHYPSDRGFHR
jgi:hypothetical protein